MRGEPGEAAARELLVGYLGYGRPGDRSRVEGDGGPRRVAPIPSGTRSIELHSPDDRGPSAGGQVSIGGGGPVDPRCAAAERSLVDGKDGIGRVDGAHPLRGNSDCAADTVDSSGGEDVEIGPRPRPGCAGASVDALDGERGIGDAERRA